jgi:hypothetical protein
MIIETVLFDIVHAEGVQGNFIFSRPFSLSAVGGRRWY